MTETTQEDAVSLYTNPLFYNFHFPERTQA